MYEMCRYATRVILTTALFLYAVFVVGKWLLPSLRSQEEKEFITGFDPFTGLSRGGVSGSSGRRFKDGQCRAYGGSLHIPESSPVSPPGGGRRCENWIVITTINPPTLTMEGLAKIEDWCMVLVFDKKTPVAAYNATASDRVVLFTVEDQIKFWNDFKLKSLQLIPWNHFGRKNVGFLYAIAHGAEVIYDTDDDNIPLGNVIPLDSALAGLDTKEPTVNIYRQFTAARVWPRGFPLERLHAAEPLLCCRMEEGAPPVWVRQFLAQHDPDVDAIYRLTSSLPLDFNTSRGGLALPAGTLVPYNAQATLHSKEAFFGLLLPITVHGRVSDIWRSYFTQKLLGLAGASIAFLPPLVRQDRNVHDYLADLDSEVPLYMKSGQLVEFLVSWAPPPDLSPADTVLRLAIALYEHCYWEEGDVRLVRAWLADLASLGHPLPSLQGGHQRPGPCSRGAPTVRQPCH